MREPKLAFIRNSVYPTSLIVLFHFEYVEIFLNADLFCDAIGSVSFFSTPNFEKDEHWNLKTVLIDVFNIMFLLFYYIV